MYFKRLEIFGFKSFADKTTLNFEPGITAVVGPNGCGKSNIFDAIRWVLGEQSSKELRGNNMEDVIFNGTEKKSSLGFAEVSLTLSNEKRSLAIDYDEVTITRRLFRSGESEYLINKTAVRLKDISELLMGTGIGAEAYSLIQQGKVDLIVSAKAEDRRQVFDEAAGITKYKSKKKEAISKLKDTENNLLRINDIIIEVKRQIASIERQANKARKYKEEFEKLKDLEIRSARYQLQGYEAQKQQMAVFLEEVRRKEQELTQELENLNNSLTNDINYLGEIDQKINEVHNEEIKLDGQVDINNRQLGFNQERLENLQTSGVKLNEQKNQLIKKCQELQERVESMKSQLGEIQHTWKVDADALVEKEEDLKILERQVKEAKEKIVEYEQKILALTSQQVNVRNELTNVMKEIQGFLARKRRLEVENAKVVQEKQEVDEKLSMIEYQLRSLEGVISDLETNKENQQKVIDVVIAKINDFVSQINEFEKKKIFLESQKEFIEKLNVQYQDIPDPVVEGRLLTHTTPLEHHTGIIGKVKGVRRIEDQSLFEIACETKFIELDPVQISFKIQEVELQIASLTAQKQEQEKLLQDEQAKLEKINEEIAIKEKAHTVFDAQKKGVLDEVTKLKGELELVDLEIGEVSTSLESIKKREEELNFNLDTLNQDAQWCKNDIKERQDWIAAQLQRKEQLIVAVAQLQKQAESHKDKMIALEENVKMFTENMDAGLVEIKQIDDDISGLETKRKQIHEEDIAIEKEIESIKLKQVDLRKVVVEQETIKNEIAQKINSVKGQINAFEDELETIKQNAHVQQLQEQQLTFNEQGVKDRLTQTYKINLEDIPVVENTEETNWEQVTQEIEQLRKRCESFGAVNLVAIEEFEELKQRFEFLTQQQSDLLTAKSQLMDTINKINRSTRQLFMDTFTKVGEEFRIYYRMLFGGGEAQLILLDPENVLESGIEIVARPPGKKLQSISLLSGGEKTLTAIALIFGLFKVNPSPFCVLDEIDAALDESNVGRFSYLLQDFAKIAQFIVITHNKKTISSADVMYGITMPETGISRIVSVKFSDKKKEEELVAA